MWGAVISVAASLAMSALAKKKSADERKKMEGLYAERQQGIDTLFNEQYGQDFLDTDVAKSTVSELQSQMKEAAGAGENVAASTGQTAEGEIAQKGMLQEKYTEALNKLAGYGTQYKDNILGRYQNQLTDLFGGKVDMANARMDDWRNFASNVSGAGGNAAAAWGTGGGYGGGGPVTDYYGNEVTPNVPYSSSR